MLKTRSLKPRRIIKCYRCNREYIPADYHNGSPILKKMTTSNLCISCAYWKWRLEEDKQLAYIHDNDVAFKKAVLKKLHVDPNNISFADMAIGGYDIPLTYTQESLDKAVQAYCEHLTQYYQNRWYFGKPLIIKEDGRLNHYIWHPDHLNTYVSYHEIGEGIPNDAILMLDGTLTIPNLSNEISSQGAIPKDIAKGYENYSQVSELLNPSYKPLEPNAVRLSEMEFLDIFYQLSEVHLNEPGVVPQKILEKYFKNLHN